MVRFLPYFVARSNAAAMDREGPPGRLLRLVVLAPAAIVVFGFGALFLYVMAEFIGWELFGI